MNKRIVTNILIFTTFITVVGVIGYKNYIRIKQDIDEKF
jgi:hypothetical protein